MKPKVDAIINECKTILERLENVETILLGEAAEIEVYDPNFIIDMDVFYQGELPPAAGRAELFGNPPVFETSPVNPVDRFLDRDLPVIIYYKELTRVDHIFRRIEEQKWIFRKETTNMLYRLKHGQVLFGRKGWIDEIRKHFDTMPLSFWKNIIDSCMFLIEHYLREINVSIFTENYLLYQNALSCFIESVCSCVFALNRQFEPSPRVLYERLCSLDILPEEFLNRFEILFNPKKGFSPERKGEVATLIAKSLIPMRLE
ncbi:MAG: DUF4037 domain-containing protein [Spirochaetales bacterium]|nr:DUF4037 domain-containing protein [Spirochaetales bacterium]